MRFDILLAEKEGGREGGREGEGEGEGDCTFWIQVCTVCNALYTIVIE